jgi:adenylyl- and sulfurtransferase ThiI
LVRLAGIKFAKAKRFKGVVFSDVAGEIGTTQKGQVGPSSEQLPVFQPLVGLDRDDLAEMCRQGGIPEEELFSQTRIEQVESNILDQPLQLRKGLSEEVVQEISL